jgi:inosine-uridine nucleoside N-ribohydrolase
MVNKNYKTQLTWLFLFLFFLVSCTTIKQTGEGNDNDLRVILDTDFGPDVDDVLAVAQLHALADLNEVEIVATVHTSSHDYGPGALSALNKWHGRIVPVGAIQVDGLYNIWLGDYTQPLYETFPRYVGLRHTVDDVTDVYRSFLSQADFKITIVTIGFLTGIELLLKSSGDHIDSRTGIELLEEKCAGIIIMGGSTKEWRSWNFHGNSNADVEYAARYVLGNWPESLPMAFCPGDGENHTWGSSQWNRNNPDDPGVAVGTDAPNQPDGHIVKAAMRAFGGVHNGAGIHLADPATVLYTVRPHRFVTRQGRLIWDTNKDDGTTTWRDESEGPHIVVDGYVGTYQELMNELEALTWTEQHSTPDN